MSPRSRLLALGAIAVTAASAVALAQPSQAPSPHAGGHPHAAMHRPQAAAVVPTLPGQDAFGAIQEIVRLLEADPATDWTKVNLGALREHLVDMSEVMFRAGAVERPVDGGVKIAVTGGNRTLQAIRRMILAHASELGRLPDWHARAEPLRDGVRLTVTSADSAQVARIRGLGFAGLLVSGAHHQPHHLAIARGEHRH